MPPFEVPERIVLHNFEDADEPTGDLVGEAQVLPMAPTLKAAARRRRERLQELGGFGFQSSLEQE